MKTDKTKLLQDIEAMKEKLAAMEKELNKPDVKHFPSSGDKYYYYSSIGYVDSVIAATDALRVNVFKTHKEAEAAYNKAVALEKVKRRILELQGDWKPNFNDIFDKYVLYYDYKTKCFRNSVWRSIKYLSIIPYIKSEEIALTIIKEMGDELKLIFDLS